MNKKYLLTAENIDVISEEIASYMEKLKIPQMGIIRGRLTAETLLLAWLEKAPANTEVTLNMGKRFFRPYVQLSFDGEKIDPLESSVDDALANDALNYFNSVMTNVGLSTTYKFRSGSNIVDIKLPMVNIGSMGKILIGVLLAFVTSYLLGFAGADFSKVVSTEVVSPLFDMMLSLLSGIATFMIFFSVLSGVCNMGDIATLSNMGLKVLNLVLGRNLIALVLGMVVSTFAFGVVELGGGVDLSVLKTVFQMFIGMVPGSLVKPFIEGNTLQIIFLAVMAGIILLILDQQVKGVIAFVNECNTLFMTAISYFCATIPVIVYLSFTNVLLSGNLGYVIKVWKPLLVIAIIAVIYIGLDTAYTGWKSGFGIVAHFKNVMPATILALSTGSAPACIPLLDKTCNGLGLDKKFLNFGLPICQILTNTGTVIAFAGVIMGFSEICGVSISIPKLIVSGVAYFIISIAAPPIPGGSISVMAILMSQALLPEYCLAIYIAVNVLLDMLLTSVNIASNVNNLVCAASALNMISKKN